MNTTVNHEIYPTLDRDTKFFIIMSKYFKRFLFKEVIQINLIFFGRVFYGKIYHESFIKLPSIAH